MRKFVFVVFCMSLVMLFVGTGCTDKKTTSTEPVSVDSMLVDSLGTDSMEALIEDEPMPKAADELFDDFIFNYAANRRLQTDRTDYPVSVDTYGKLSRVEKSKWGMEHFFMRQGYYTLIFDNRKQMNLVKDTTIDHVIIEKVFFKIKTVKQYLFNRINGRWMMTSINLKPMFENNNASFF